MTPFNEWAQQVREAVENKLREKGPLLRAPTDVEIAEYTAKEDAEVARRIAQETIKACAKVCDDMVDWPDEKHPCATISKPAYFIGIRRGLVNTTNAIRALNLDSIGNEK